VSRTGVASQQRSRHSLKRRPWAQLALAVRGRYADDQGSLWEEWRPRSLCQSRWSVSVERGLQSEKMRAGCGVGDLWDGWLESV
jgi:hypothetical protein